MKWKNNGVVEFNFYRKLADASQQTVLNIHYTYSQRS